MLIGCLDRYICVGTISIAKEAFVGRLRSSFLFSFSDRFLVSPRVTSYARIGVSAVSITRHKLPRERGITLPHARPICSAKTEAVFSLCSRDLSPFCSADPIKTYLYFYIYIYYK